MASSSSDARRVALVLDVGNSLSSLSTQIAAELSSSSFDGDILVTSESNFEGLDAVKHVLHVTNKQREHVHFHNLDPLDKGSIGMLKDFLMEHYEGLDILINSLQLDQQIQGNDANPDQGSEKFSQRLYFGTRNVCNALLPLLKSGGRVVHFADWTNIARPEWDRAKEQMRFTRDFEQLDTLFQQVMAEDVKDDVSWPSSFMQRTHLFLASLVPMHQQQLDDEQNLEDRVANMVQMPSSTSTSSRGPSTQAVLAALLPPNTKVRGVLIVDSHQLDVQSDANLVTHRL